MKQSRKEQGFTLIEVLLVIVILGLLAAVAVVAMSGTREGAKIDTTKLLMQELETGMETYNMHVGHYPTEEEGGLDALTTKPTFDEEGSEDKWRGPYLKKEAKDAWGNDFSYEAVEADALSEGSSTPFKLWSNGPDGQSGTEDDIKNWSDEDNL